MSANYVFINGRYRPAANNPPLYPDNLMRTTTTPHQTNYYDQPRRSHLPSPPYNYPAAHRRTPPPRQTDTRRRDGPSRGDHVRDLAAAEARQMQVEAARARPPGYQQPSSVTTPRGTSRPLTNEPRYTQSRLPAGSLHRRPISEQFHKYFDQHRKDIPQKLGQGDRGAVYSFRSSQERSKGTTTCIKVIKQFDDPYGLEFKHMQWAHALCRSFGGQAKVPRAIAIKRTAAEDGDSLLMHMERIRDSVVRPVR